MKTKKNSGVVVYGVYTRRKQENGEGGFVLGACITQHKQRSDGECFGGGGVAWKAAVVVLWGLQPTAKREGEWC